MSTSIIRLVLKTNYSSDGFLERLAMRDVCSCFTENSRYEASRNVRST